MDDGIFAAVLDDKFHMFYEAEFVPWYLGGMA